MQFDILNAVSPVKYGERVGVLEPVHREDDQGDWPRGRTGMVAALSLDGEEWAYAVVLDGEEDARCFLLDELTRQGTVKVLV